MADRLDDRLERAPVVPLVQAEDPAVAVAMSRALAAGGLSVIEVVLRTAGALDCLRAIGDELPEVIAGAGTVLTKAQAEESLAHGARFIVSPGLDRDVVATARGAGVPMYPGVVTATEVQAAWNLGLTAVKFFPASIAGGVPALKAHGSVFRGMRFMPTGGITPGNLADYLALPQVLACGGSWLTPQDAIDAGDFDTLTRLAQEALAIAANARPAG